MSKMPISFKKGAGVTSISHNNRELKEKDWENEFHSHIDRERTPNNVIIKQEHIRDAYERIFGEALQKYNDKQRRKDRKIDNYYDHVKNSKTLHTQYEFIVQVGKAEDFVDNSKNWETANEILVEYVEEFQERNPNFEIYNAVVHNDEASPHLHLNVIPVAEGYKRGLERQPGFNKALEQQGVEFDTDTRTIFRNFRDQEVDSVEVSLNKRGIDREKVGTNNIENHHEYKEMKQEVEKMTVELEKAESNVNTLLNNKNATELKSEQLERHLESVQVKVSENREILSKQGETFEKQKKWQQNFSGASSLGQTMQKVERHTAYVPKKNGLGVTVAQKEPELVSIKQADYDNYDSQLTAAHQARLIAERRTEEERSEKEKALKDRDKWLRERNSIVDDHNYYLEKSEELEEENDELKQENSALKVKVDRIEVVFLRAHTFVDERLPDFGDNSYKKSFHRFLDRTEAWVEEKAVPEHKINRNRGGYER